MACQKGAGRAVALAAKQLVAVLLLARLVLTCCAVLLKVKAENEATNGDVPASTDWTTSRNIMQLYVAMCALVRL
jgi:hypothetical protein